MSDGAKVVKVKVSPYPIAVTFGVAPNLIRGRILKLTQKGFLAEVDSAHLRVNEKIEAQFTLPVLGIDYKEGVIIVKTYERMSVVGTGGTKPNRLMEFHFLHLTNPESIARFLIQIGQTK